MNIGGNTDLQLNIRKKNVAEKKLELSDGDTGEA